jgi:hypothetical protein
MTVRSAPPLAIRLLQNAGCDETFIGDLLEEHAAGRSQAWFWRQTVLALKAAFLCQFCEHPILLLRALAMTWVVWSVLFFVAAAVLRSAHDLLTDVIPLAIYMQLHLYAVMGMLLGFSASMVSAWIVAMLHGPVRVPATLLIFVVAVTVTVVDPEVHRLWANLPEQRFIPYFALRVCRHIMVAAGVLIGGGLLPVVGRGQNGRPSPPQTRAQHASYLAR